MILSDKHLLKLQRKKQIIHPFNQENLQPASYDMTLSEDLIVYKDSYIDIKEMSKQNLTNGTRMIGGKTELKPGEFKLGSTIERVFIPNKYVGRVEGKSSLARLGLIVHTTAGFIDPGFKGNITLELCNLNSIPIILYAGMKIAQLCIYKMSGPSLVLYGSESLGSKYQDSVGTVASRYNL